MTVSHGDSKQTQTVLRHCANCWREVKGASFQYCPSCGAALSADAEPGMRVGTAPNLLVLSVNNAVIYIGRSPDNDVSLDHPAVSRRHARLEWRPGETRWYVVDEGSARGTFVDYQQVPHGALGHPVNPGDTLWIAPYAFRLVSGEQNQQHQFEPAHLRLDAASLVRTVKHERRRATIPILNLESMPLSFRPGEFIALVGGSGAGKSTLMKALLGLEPAQQGSVYVSARPFIENGQAQQFAAMHAVVGYVPQDDVVHHDLTVREAIDYIARFRLASDLTQGERLDYIYETLITVELWPHRDKLIRRLSGGQRKRVNIALELLARPRLLFLDEPTSGLDPGLDLSIMEMLRAWATDPDDPRTIILVTHATENVTNCKYVAFMAPGGFVVYFGPPERALAHFGVTRFAEIYRLVGGYQLPELVTGEESASTQPDVRELVNQFHQSRDYFQYVEMRALSQAEVESARAGARARQERGEATWGTAARQRFRNQLRLLISRYWKLLRRDRMSFAVLLLQGLFVAGLLRTVARPDTFLPRGAEDAQTVLFIMACAAVWLGILNASKEIVKEQDIYERERRYGLAAAPYVLSKLVVLALVGAFQMGSLLLLIGFHFALPARGVLGAWSPAWLEWFITLELTLVAGLALGLCLSAYTRTSDAATAATFVLLLIQVMFAGLFFPDAAWADALSILTFSRWGLEGAAVTANLNGILQAAVGSSYRPEPAYTFSPMHLLAQWAILGGYTGLLTFGAIWRQRRKR
jgi:ABC transport system ATP-binding/permease protein